MLQNVDISKTMQEKRILRTTFDHFWRYLRCHLVIWTRFFVAFLIGKILWENLLNRLHLVKHNKIINSVKAKTVSVLVACRTHNLEVPGSNPVGVQMYFLDLFFAAISNVNVIFHLLFTILISFS